uniref:FecR domain-containing protein n=1 Tax=Sphingosinicella sp. CPCC 101087 TaxID=2497754 RepID=UPI0013E9C211
MKKLFLGIAPLMLASGGPAAAQSSAWRISEVSGTVRVIEDGRTRAATRGALLASGSAIATAAQGRAVLVRGREFVIVSPNSQIRIPEPGLAQRASQTGQARGGVMQWLSDWGTALFRIERRETPHFGVQTPYLAAVVKGTTFTVTVGPAGASVQVTEGAVEVSTPDGGAVELIRPGMIASVDADDLYQLNIDGETSRSIRSPSAPPAGVVTTAVAPASNTPYVGPSTPAATLAVAVAEDPVLLSETTDGLIEGRAGFDLDDEEASFELAMADVADAVHRVDVDNGGEVPPPPVDDNDEVPPPPPVDD